MAMRDDIDAPEELRPRVSMGTPDDPGGTRDYTSEGLSQMVADSMIIASEGGPAEAVKEVIESVKEVVESVKADKAEIAPDTPTEPEDDDTVMWLVIGGLTVIVLGSVGIGIAVMGSEQ